MYDLVVDVQRYPEFLPWCSRADVLASEPTGITARLGIGYGGLTQSFTTRNRHDLGRRVDLELVDGPFSALTGHWQFSRVGPANAGQRACKVLFELNYEFSNAALAGLVGPVFDGIATNFVDAFVKRAEALYGDA